MGLIKKGTVKPTGPLPGNEEPQLGTVNPILKRIKTDKMSKKYCYAGNIRCGHFRKTSVGGICDVLNKDGIKSLFLYDFKIEKCAWPSKQVPIN